MSSQRPPRSDEPDDDAERGSAEERDAAAGALDRELGADALDKGEPDEDAAEGDVPVVPIEDAIDLHGFQPRDIPSVVEEYVRAAAEKGLREVRLIHGRGTGFQRHRVRQVLATCPEVERFSDAPPTRGGWGATVVWLKPQR